MPSRWSRVVVWIAALISNAKVFAADGSKLPSFPGAEGFGALAIGARGGAVYRVTTLAESGPGSFREAVSRPGRTVVFAVGGVIRLNSDVTLSSDLTIAGETAPGEGIGIYGRSVSLSQRRNVIVRYLRFRQGMGGDRGKKSLGMAGAQNIVIDHCSIAWGRWDDLGITVGSHDITVQHCILAEAIHPQSFGALVDSVANVTLSHNLWMSNESRNPKAKGTLQFINNVVYNWGYTGLCGGHSGADRWLDVIGNVFIGGPSSNDRFAGQFLATDHVYQRDNVIDLNANGVFDGRTAEAAEFHRADEERYTLPTFTHEPALRPLVPVTVMNAAETLTGVLNEAGCSLSRDAVDRRLVAELSSLGRKGATLAHTDTRGEALVGGQGEITGGEVPLDGDGDGLPDGWETARGLDASNPADSVRLTESGYSELELYLHHRARVVWEKP